MYRNLTRTLALGAALLLGGCILPVHHHGPRHHTRATVHVHGSGCGHVYTGGRWVVHRRSTTHVGKILADGHHDEH